uniref:C2H2-type domain-containing protein n=1 Tax=Acrobeloides nanus TaxID=290746 RepID=A0A914CQ57_9BILA
MQPNGFHPAPFVQHHQTLFEAISGNPIHTPPTFPMNPILLQNSAEKKFPELPVPEPIPIVEELKKPNNCIREQPLDQAYIDSYITKNKHKLFPCRKCKILFPSREYLSRHMAYHNYMDSYEFECPKCPQRFIYEKQLVNHLNLHSDNSPHKCLQCEAMFRSSMSLRRHRDQCRSCIRYPFGIQPDLLVSQPTPLDQYAFIESDDEDDHHNLRKVAENLNRQKSATDSGLGSDSSTHSLNNSPNRSHNLDDEFDDHHHHVFHPPESTMLHHKTSTESMIPSTSNGGLRQRKTSEDTETDDVDSGFRSRLNSSIPSCSPGSSGNGSEAGTSPSRKFSANGMNHMANDLFIHGYGSMSYNYHNGHGNSKPIHHQQAPTSAMNYGRNFGSTFVTMTSS